jgi:hypothetical protein
VQGGAGQTGGNAAPGDSQGQAERRERLKMNKAAGALAREEGEAAARRVKVFVAVGECVHPRFIVRKTFRGGIAQ